MKLKDKVAIVTGGAGSIGLASAKLFAAEGARVMLADLREDDLRRAAAALPAAQVATAVTDVREAESVKACVEAAVARFGKIDVLFSNAGNVGAIAPIADYPEVSFDDVFQVHVKGAFLLCKYGLPQMNDGGSVIITSSVVGLTGNPGPYGYITAKHAQVGLMRAVAKEVARRRIRVNTLHPGPIHNAFQQGVEDTMSKIIGRDATKFFDEIIPLGRHAEPEEIARAVLFLACDDSSFTTGHTFTADGGMTA